MRKTTIRGVTGAKGYLDIQPQLCLFWYNIDGWWWGATNMVTGAGIMVVVGLQGDDEVSY